MDDASRRAIANYYTDYSSWYDGERRFGYYELINDLEVMQVAPAVEGVAALEVGCGTGLLLERTSKGSDRCVGVDLSPGMASVASEKGLKVANGSVNALPFADGAFDVVYSCKVLPHVPDLAGALREVQRVLAPGGRMFLEFYNPLSFKAFTYRLRWLGKEPPVYIRFHSMRDLTRVLPPDVEVVGVRGIRIIGVARHFYTLPGLRRFSSWFDRRFCDSWLGQRFGGYRLVEMADTRVHAGSTQAPGPAGATA